MRGQCWRLRTAFRRAQPSLSTVSAVGVWCQVLAARGKRRVQLPRTWKRKLLPRIEAPHNAQPSVAVKLPTVVLTPALLRARRQAWDMRFNLVRPRVWVFHSHLRRELVLARPRVHRLPTNRVSVTRVRYHHQPPATLKPASHALVMFANLNKRHAWLKTPHVRGQKKVPSAGTPLHHAPAVVVNLPRRALERMRHCHTTPMATSFRMVHPTRAQVH